jgi:mannan endo-1,4-beta-mannosidase
MLGGAALAAASQATVAGVSVSGCLPLPPPKHPPANTPTRNVSPSGVTGTDTAPVPVLAASPISGALSIRGGRFFHGDRPFVIKGFNYWSALPLARTGNNTGWDQLRRDLDVLQATGINMLRIIGASEGPNNEPFRIVPALQPAPGQYAPDSVAGLLRLVAELERRGLFAILVMNNFWHWSGGMGQYLAWAGQGAIPYPPPQRGGSWGRYQHYAARFYSSDAARRMFQDLLRFLVPQLKTSPAVLWELANEPRGIDNTTAFHAWIDETAGLLKTLAPGQLVTTGSEGQTPSSWSSGTDLVRDHQSPHIDFATFHLWAQNWGWINPNDIARGFPRAVEKALAYIDDHARRAASLRKPLLLEEFGFPRDGGSFDPRSPTTWRDQYFQAVYGRVHELLASPATPLAGIMPWAWSGDTLPPRPGELWRAGDPFTGDPPHEPQGWYGIYAHDTTTLRVIQDVPIGSR